MNKQEIVEDIAVGGLAFSGLGYFATTTDPIPGAFVALGFVCMAILWRSQPKMGKGLPKNW